MKAVSLKGNKCTDISLLHIKEVLDGGGSPMESANFWNKVYLQQTKNLKHYLFAGQRLVIKAAHIKNAFQ